MHECRDACSDASSLVGEVGGGHSTCCVGCSVDSHPVLPWLHAARCSRVPLVGSHYEQTEIVAYLASKRDTIPKVQMLAFVMDAISAYAL